MNVTLAPFRGDVANGEFVERAGHPQKERSLGPADIFVGLAAAILSLLFEHHDTLSASHNTNCAALRVSIPIRGLPDTRVTFVTAHGARSRSNKDGESQFRRFAPGDREPRPSVLYIRFVARTPAEAIETPASY